ncbi:MAG: DUF6350 family protein [Nocardioidaceae bacterium]
MTSLLPAQKSATHHAAAQNAAARSDLRHRRPLVLIGLLGGASAAATTLLLSLGVAITGWYLADAGSHGEPHDALRVGALAWLTAHGSGVRVQGALVTALPLLLTLGCAWTVWRIGHRVGDSVSGHGPDADRLADGERDWTVPATTVLFTVGYAAVVLVTARLAATPATAPSLGRALAFSVLLSLVVAGSAIAVGSGRLAIWAAFVPEVVRATLATAGRVLAMFLVASSVAWLVSLALDLSAAANVVSQLHLGTADTAMYLLVAALLAPNATLFAGSYLVGPGFSVGVGTLVSPTAVVLGPLPLFPLLAALPDAGPTPAWTPYLMGVPAVIAALATTRAQRFRPTLRWDHAVVRGGVGGMLAAAGLGLVTSLSGGAVGPGRMRLVGPDAFVVFTHALPAFAVGGILGALVATWWQRRAARPREAAVPAD